MKEKEFFYFHGGINRKKSPLLLGETEAYTLENYSFETEGKLEPRSFREIKCSVSNGGDPVAIKRYEDNVYFIHRRLCHGALTDAEAWASEETTTNYFKYIARRSTDGTPSYSGIGISRSNTYVPPKMVGYKKFMFYADDDQLFAFDNEHAFKWIIPTPTVAPVPVINASSGGNLSEGTYGYKYTYYIQFPNGEAVETGPSPAGTIAVTDDDITQVFHSPPALDYNSHDMTQLTVSVRLYRTTADGSTYYLLTPSFIDEAWGTVPVGDAYGIPNKVYDRAGTGVPNWNLDDVTSDTNLVLNSSLTTTSYDSVPTGLNDIELHGQRIFGIKDDKLYWSEEYLPFNWKSASNYIAVSRDGEYLTALCTWGDKLWIASKMRWYELRGYDDDSWAIRNTWTDKGVINKNTVHRTEYGILGLSYEGICLFNGYNSKCLTEEILGKEFFDTISNTDTCYAEWDGRRYWFYYPTTGNYLDACIILDFSMYPNIRVYQDTFLAGGHSYHRDSGTRYFAKDNDEYYEDDYEVFTSTWTTGERDFGDITERKYLTELHYDVKGTFTIYIYADGVEAQQIAVAKTSRARDMVKLGRIEGYRFQLKVYAVNSSSIEIYEPMTLIATRAGTS